jgi:nucleotide-binding universal stress UspA family protein
MAAGFVIINQDHRDVRLFRTLNAFEPPIYVLFFTLAGAQLDIAAMANAGWVGLVYFLLRSLGKVAGAGLGARCIAALPQVRRYLGLALVPQAGIAIGFILLIQGDQELAVYASVIIPVVLAGVFLSELVGPACIRMAVERAGEALSEGEEPAPPVPAEQLAGEMIQGSDDPSLPPWSWGHLLPADDAEGAVIFGASNAATVAGLARIATLLAHYHQARPLAVRVISPGREIGAAGGRQEEQVLFRIESAEVRRLGYDLDTAVIHADNVATGILAATCRSKTWGIVLGYPVELPVPEFERVVEKVALAAPCPVIVVRFSGILHTERILVPLASSRELEIVRSTLCALANVGRHRITLLRLMSSDVREKELAKARNGLVKWTARHGLTSFARCRAIATEARLETIVQEGFNYDLLLLAAPRRKGLKRLFFGSLAEDVAKECHLPMILVHVPHPGDR